MQLHQLTPRTKSYKYPRVGRGGKRGKTAGKGTKGQKARAGRKMRPELRDIIKKFPKARGYRFKAVVTKPSVVNVGDIASAFSAGAEVTPTTLVLAGLVRRVDGRIPDVKILGMGELAAALKVSGCTVSLSAKASIEKAGGTVVVPVKDQPTVPKKEEKQEKKEKKEKEKKEKAAASAKEEKDKKDAAKAKKTAKDAKKEAPKSDKTDKSDKKEKKA